MTLDAVADSCVVAKWLLIEPDTPEALRVFADVKTRGGRLIVLDLALIEVAQAIWKRVHRGLLIPEEGERLTEALLALPEDLGLVGVTTDGPLQKAVAGVLKKTPLRMRKRVGPTSVGPAKQDIS